MNCIGMPVGENSSLFNLLLDYMELLYDRRCVVSDLIPYFKIMPFNDLETFSIKIDQKIEQMEAVY